MDAMRFLQDLSVVLITAAVALALFRKAGLPPVLGYLMAGIVIGPYTPPHVLVADRHSLEALSEIGVVFLLFALGVEFNLWRLARVGAAALLGAFLEAALLLALGAGAAALLGWSALEGLLLGGVISIAGTAIVARTLLERSALREPWTELASGILVAEDMLAVLMIAFFSSAAAFGSPDAAALWSAAVRFGVLVTLIVTVGLLALPRLLEAVEKTKLEEVRTLIVVGACFATALLTEKLGFSAALGAFLAGTMASSGGEQERLHRVVVPFRDVFGAVFFVSVGMMIDPAWLLAQWPLTLGLSAFVVLARGGVNLGVLLAVGQPLPAAGRAALAMLPIGEFSFILAQIGQRRGLTELPFYPLAVTLCLATTVVSAALLPLSDRALEGADELLPRRMSRALESYRAALGRLSAPGRAGLAWRLVRPSLIQIALNAALVAGVFLGAESVAGEAYSRHPRAAWLLCTVLSMPSLSAIIRKIHAVLLILAEASRPAGAAPPAESHPGFVRALGAAAVALTLWGYTLLSLPLLPPWPHSALPIGAVAVAALLSWRALTKVYSRLQTALRETLAKGNAPPETSAAALMHFAHSLTPAHMSVRACRVSASSWAAGRALGEISLRSRTGASVLQVTRGQGVIPAPDVSLRFAAGDELLLIGSDEQLAAAAALLEKGLPRD